MSSPLTEPITVVITVDITGTAEDGGGSHEDDVYDPGVYDPDVFE